MDTLLSNILNAKNELKISDAKFQKDLGLYSSAVAEWKNGKSKSYEKHLSKIADYLNVSTDFLLGKDKQKQKPTANSDNELDNEIIKLFNELPPHLQEQAMRHLRFLASEKDSEDKK